jgi:transcriptional regulator with XRE-family HTH domain
MSATLKTKQQFVELRANNESYEKIAKKLKVSKTTLIAWAKDSELDTENLRAITYEALQEQYKVGQQHRLQMWSEQLEAVRTELKTRGLGDLPTAKLIELLDTLSEKLKSETYNVRFKSEPEVKPYEMFDIEKSTTPEQDTWHG